MALNIDTACRGLTNLSNCTKIHAGAEKVASLWEKNDDLLKSSSKRHSGAEKVDYEF